MLLHLHWSCASIFVQRYLCFFGCRAAGSNGCADLVGSRAKPGALCHPKRFCERESLGWSTEYYIQQGIYSAVLGMLVGSMCHSGRIWHVSQARPFVVAVSLMLPFCPACVQATTSFWEGGSGVVGQWSVLGKPEAWCAARCQAHCLLPVGTDMRLPLPQGLNKTMCCAIPRLRLC
jgi:hypothetical protein